MILLDFLLWIILCYVIIEQSFTIQNNLLKGTLATLFTFSFLSFAFCISLFAGINFTIFQLAFIIIPLTLLVVQRNNAIIAIINIFNRKNFPSFFTSFIVLFCIYIFSFLFFTYTFRWGNWDAVAIWN